MSSDRPADYLLSLLHELCALPRETEWVEFKVSEAEPQAIGEYISALANAAALVGKAFAYLVWGVSDEDHVVFATASRPLGEAVEAGLVVIADPDAAPKLMRYLPFWAAAPAEGRR